MANKRKYNEKLYIDASRKIWWPGGQGELVDYNCHWVPMKRVEGLGRMGVQIIILPLLSAREKSYLINLVSDFLIFKMGI